LRRGNTDLATGSQGNALRLVPATWRRLDPAAVAAPRPLLLPCRDALARDHSAWHCGLGHSPVAARALWRTTSKGDWTQARRTPKPRLTKGRLMSDVTHAMRKFKVLASGTNRCNIKTRDTTRPPQGFFSTIAWVCPANPLVSAGRTADEIEQDRKMGRPTASLTGVPLLTAAWVADGVILKRRNPLSVRPADRAGPVAKSFTPTRLRAIPATAPRVGGPATNV
jgi:hypothetical protein